MAFRERRLDGRALLAWVALSAVVCFLWGCGAISVLGPTLLMAIALILGEDTFIREE